MKILQINSVCGIGSTGRIATDIHNILIDQGHESYIAYGRDLPKNCDNAIRIGTKIDNYTHVAKTRLLDKHGFGSIKATKEFINKVKDIDPDIIHLHNMHGYYINIEVLFNYLKETNKPIVWTLHDCWSFTGHCAYFDYAGCDKWKKGCYSCPEKKAYPSSLIFDNSKGNYINKKEIFTGVKNLTIVTPSQWLANLVQESFLNEYPVKVINNGIDLNTFRPNEGDFRKKYNLYGKFIILGVASVWDRRKGLKYFVELADKVSEDEVIVLVGLTEKQINQIPENIIGITRTNNVEELVDIYSSSDVFVNPTLEDNFPTTNLEATLFKPRLEKCTWNNLYALMGVAAAGGVLNLFVAAAMRTFYLFDMFIILILPEIFHSGRKMDKTIKGGMYLFLYASTFMYLIYYFSYNWHDILPYKFR